MRRREIAEIVAALVLDIGIEGITIRGVAAKVGFNTAVVLHYFRTKREMLIFTQKEARRRALTRLARARGEGMDLFSCLQTVLPNTLDRWRDWHILSAFWGMSPAQPGISQEWLDATSEAYVLFADLVRTEQERGRFDENRDPEAVAIDIQIVINGIATLALQDSLSWPPERQGSSLHQNLLRMGMR